MTWESFIWGTTGIAAFTVQMVYFLLDDREANHTPVDRRLKLYWHAAAGACHIWMGCFIGRQFGWEHGLFNAAIMWIVFDGAINTWVLHREWWYIGDTAQLDIAQRKVAGFLRIDHRLFSACLKGAALIVSIILLIPNLL
jgi:hypothetical protein